MNALWYYEDLLTDQLGLTASALRQYRHSLKKSEWQKQDRKILLHETAVRRLLQDLGIADPVQFDLSKCAAQENGAADPPVLIIELTVHRIFPNPRLLLAIRDDNQELVRVKVPNNINFQPRMKIKARPPLLTGGPQLYILEGRCPRFRGRW